MDDAPSAQGKVAFDGDVIADPIELLASMGQDFVGCQDIDQTLCKALGRITSHLQAEGGALFLLDEGGNTLTCTCCVGATDIEGLRLASDQGIVGRSVQSNRGELVRDVRTDPGFFDGVDQQTGFMTRSIVCAPMSVRDARLGAIELVNKKGADPRFTVDDLRMLETMASSAALAILNAQMAQALVEQERVRRELELAAEIQRGLLPRAQPGDFPLHGINAPAGTVSGDFYDFFVLPDGRICFNLGDVSGKGMNAALLMAKTASLYRCLGKTIHAPGALLARINTEICETAARGMFVTMVAGLYDPATGEVRLANAGHEPPLLHRLRQGFKPFPADVPPLGIVCSDPDPFPETAFHLDGGTLYVFSDGVTEGYLADGTMLRTDGLQGVLRQHEDLPAAHRLAAVAELFAGHPLRDDVTLLAVDDGPRLALRHAAEDEGGGGCEAFGNELVQVAIPSRADRLRLVRHVISLTAAQCGCSEMVAGDLMLAVDEACQNIIRHAYRGDPQGRIIVKVYEKGDDLVILLRDFADPIDVASVRPRDLGDLRPGGLGTHLMREVVDRVEFLPSPPGGGNLLKLVKRVR